MFGKSLVLYSIELKRHTVDLPPRSLEGHEVACVRTANRIQDRHLVTLGDDERNRQLQVGKGGVKPGEILLESLAPRALARQMIVVVLCHDLVKDVKIGRFG